MMSPRRRRILLILLIVLQIFIIRYMTHRTRGTPAKLIPLRLRHGNFKKPTFDFGIANNNGFEELQRHRFDHRIDVKPRGIKDFLEYLVFIMVFDGDSDEILTSARGFVGGLHRLLKGSHKVPLTLIFTYYPWPKSHVEEISVWSRVQLHIIPQYLGITQEKYSYKQLLHRVACEYGNAIWVKCGYTFDPAGISYRQAEGTQDPSKIRDANEYSRKFMKSLYQTLQTRGYLQVVEPKDGMLVLEGYSYGHDGFKVLLSNDEPVRRHETKDFGIIEYNSRSNISCYIDVKVEAIHNFSLMRPIAETTKSAKYEMMVKKSGMRKLVIAFPTTSKGLAPGEEPIFFKAILPTLLDTLTVKELDKCLIDVYIGFDCDDPMLDDHMNIRSYVQRCESLFLGKPIQVKFFRFPKLQRIGLFWSMLFAKAMREGAYYFYQVNDDLRLVTQGWLTKFARALDQNGGFGVAGPADNFVGFNCTLLTQAMVTHKHFEIFGPEFYPSGLRDWKTDVWLSKVYGRENTFCWHDYIANNGGIKTKRYTHCPSANWKIYLEMGREKIETWKRLK